MKKLIAYTLLGCTFTFVVMAQSSNEIASGSVTNSVTNGVSTNSYRKAIEQLLKTPKAVNPPLAPVVRPPLANKYKGQ